MGYMGSVRTRKFRMVTFARLVFYRSFACDSNDITPPCGLINLVEVCTLILVCKIGRLPHQKWPEVGGAGESIN